MKNVLEYHFVNIVYPGMNTLGTVWLIGLLMDRYISVTKPSGLSDAKPIGSTT